MNIYQVRIPPTGIEAATPQATPQAAVMVEVLVDVGSGMSDTRRKLYEADGR